MVAGLIIAATSGYMLIEGWSLLDAVYMTVLTLTTVGYREVKVLSHWGMIFNIFVMLFGVGTMLYLVGTLAQIMLEGQIRTILGRRKLEKKIHGLKNHYIVCGYGRMGETVAKEIQLTGEPLVIVEKDEGNISRLENLGMLYVMGDATDENVLNAAGIKKAKGLVSVLTSDVENVYVTLTARGLNHDLFILSRATEPGAETKLTRAGASKVVSPYRLSGRKMAQELLKPTITNFIELVFQEERGTSIDLQMEELLVGKGSELIDKSLMDSKIRQELNLIVVAIKKKSGEMLYNPTFAALIEEGDTLVAMGPGPNLEKLASKLNSRH
jgi:voltage-gated potassium channel